MKTLTCSDLGGPCAAELVGTTFEDIGRASRAHVMSMIKAGHADHIAAADRMRQAPPEEQRAMMARFKDRFEEAPNI
mgnify:CR=1 FL=1